MSQTKQFGLPGGVFRHYTVHLFSKHVFEIHGFVQSIELSAKHEISGRTDYDGPNYLSAMQLQLTSIFLTFSFDQLRQLANKVVEWVRN